MKVENIVLFFTRNSYLFIFSKKYLYLKEIIFTRHCELRIKERQLDKNKIIKIFYKFNFSLYDIDNKNFIIISNKTIDNYHFIIIFNIKNNKAKIITIYPCKDIKNELKKKLGKRWFYYFNF